MDDSPLKLIFIELVSYTEPDYTRRVVSTVAKYVRTRRGGKEANLSQIKWK